MWMELKGLLLNQKIQLSQEKKGEKIVLWMEVSRNNCRAVLCSFLLRADWQKIDSSVRREPQGKWRWNSNSRDVVASSPSFSCPAARVPRRACLQAIPKANPQSASYTQVKKVKAHMSQRPKWPELICVSLVWSMPRSITTPPWMGC